MRGGEIESYRSDGESRQCSLLRGYLLALWDHNY